MKEASYSNGQDLREMFSVATSWLEKSASEIDALNVFPVPDGDTGTNMLLTMRSTMEEAYRAPDQSASAVAQAMARGALMGARGNSGVILSQIWNGLAQGLEGKDSFSGRDFANAFVRASTMAYKGISNPVEGTILTVSREAAAAGEAVAADSADLVSVLDAIVGTASESVANTPNLLPVLKYSGVVDAGGQGLYTILEGALRYLKGESERMQFRKPQIIVSDVAPSARLSRQTPDEVPYGYCTEFLLKGQGLDTERIRRRLNRRGESLIVVGDQSTVRVHIHTLDPGLIIRYATSLGTLHQISIRNMDEQHEDYLEMQKDKLPATDIAVIAVAAGDGLNEVFNSLGAIVVPGGQTMNPSTKDLLRAVDSLIPNKVIILPNNKNIVLAAEQVHSLTEKEIKVVPTKTTPQGVAALLAFDYEADFETNAQRMEKAVSAIRSIEITRATRSTQIGDLTIKRKQAIGLLDTDLVAVDDDAADVLKQVLTRLNLDKAEVVTIYYGARIEQAEAEAFSAGVIEQYPHLQTEVVRGGQPHYEYIISIE